MHSFRHTVVAPWILLASVAGVPPVLVAQGVVLGPSTAYYQFGTPTSGSGRERVWTLGVRVGLPAFGRKGEFGFTLEHSVLGNQSQGPKVFALRTELQYALRSPPAAIVRPHVVAGLGAIHFQSSGLIFPATCPAGFNVCVLTRGYSSSGWQLTGSAGVGLTVALSPMLWLAPRAEGVLPLWRLSGGSDAPLYVRWSLALALQL